MGEPALKRERFTYAEYLELEADSPARHIFWDGEVFAMAGGSIQHNTLESNVHGLLFAALRGQPCRPFTGNCRLRALNSERAVFADVVVVCGPVITHPADGTATTNPTVVVEVLSKSTEAFDRGDKFVYYRSFPTLRSVLFLSQREVRVERYVRGLDDDWRLRDLGPGGTLEIPEIGARLAVEQIYENVHFDDVED